MFDIFTLSYQLISGTHDGARVSVPAVRERLQGGSNSAPSPEDPQCRVPGTMRRLSEGVPDQVAAQAASGLNQKFPHFTE
jgi:hypothetical protein